MRYRGKVKTLDEAIAKEPAIGDGFLLEPENQMYIWSGTEWQVAKKDINLKLSNYELNQQVITQLPEITEDALQEGKEEIEKFVKSCNDTYFMLLCKDESYYTVFHYAPAQGDFNSMAEAVIELIKELGVLKAIESVPGAIEIWITNSKVESHAFYLFPYDAGIVELTDERFG